MGRIDAERAEETQAAAQPTTTEALDRLIGELCASIDRIVTILEVHESRLDDLEASHE